MKLGDLMRSDSETFYANLHTVLPGSAFSFMNHGYSSRDLVSVDGCPQSNCANLVAHLIGGINFDGKSVVEIGCGRGGAANFICKTRNPASYLGIDLSAGNVSYCQSHSSSPNLSFVQGDANKIELPLDSVDVVINIESSHCYANLDNFFGHVFDMLSIGGVFAYTDVFPAQHSSLIELKLKNAGFTIERSEDITRGVIEALKSDREVMKSILLDSRDNSLASESDIDFLVRCVIDEPLKGYSANQMEYHLWNASK